MNRHSFHIVDTSPWPMTGAFGGLGLTVGLASIFHKIEGGLITFLLGLSLIIMTMIVWWKDVIRESTYLGIHTQAVQNGLFYVAILFITSELFLFASVFWAFFHSSLAPTIEIGCIWPPVGITPLDAWHVPLLNTVILVSSGVTATWAHHAVISGNKKESITGLLWTIVLGLIFTLLQIMEYWEAPFTITDSIYGSTFFMATGLHGLHVIVGTAFLAVCLYRLVENQLWSKHHFGLVFALWYWHFVDVVWLFLFVVIYSWGS